MSMRIWQVTLDITVEGNLPSQTDIATVIGTDDVNSIRACVCKSLIGTDADVTVTNGDLVSQSVVRKVTAVSVREFKLIGNADFLDMDALIEAGIVEFNRETQGEESPAVVTEQIGSTSNDLEVHPVDEQGAGKEERGDREPEDSNE